MTTLVTGAFGCIGAWTIRGLLAAGEHPVVFDLGDDPWCVRMIAGPDAPGRDFGLTADPTLAMKAAVLGRRFQIRWGGATDLIYTEDVARALIKASRAGLDRARVYNLHGSASAIADVVRTIETAWPQAKGLITHAEQALPFPAALDDTRYQRDLGPATPTALVDGVRRTLDEFARLHADGRLDARELG